MTSTPRIRTELTELLRIEHPVLLAPMGGTAGGRLAAAVSEAGGLGLIGGGYADVDWLRRELALAGEARVGVGFITFALDLHPEALELALEAGADVIQLSFGDPARYVDAIRDAGATLICQVQSADDIHFAMAAGADVLIAQGQDSGGHGRPDRATMGLVPAVVDRVAPVPVAAAGGIADGRGLAAALALGASGVSLGTRFLASAEALSSDAEAAALIASRTDDTVRTPVFDLIRGPAWPEGHDARAIRNDLVERWDGRVDELEANRAELEAEYRTSAPDDFAVRAVWAGEGLDLITEVPPAADVLRSIIAEAVEHLQRAASLIDDAT